MCGIVGISSKKKISSKELIKCLKKLEYRGYDSAGISMNFFGKSKDFPRSRKIKIFPKIYTEKSVGNISKLEKKLKKIEGNIGIAHTRWATHGKVNEINAHPHTDCKNEIRIIHNGIIDNYISLKKNLEKKGHYFKSETDSEIIAHFFEEELKEKNLHEAVKKFFSLIKGEFAILMIMKNDNNIYALKKGSPLVLGINEKNIVSSDINAFLDKTNKVIFFNENEFAIISDNYEFYKYENSKLKKQHKKIDKIKWIFQESKNKYEHFMLKEIMEQPKVSNELIKSLETTQNEKLLKLKKMIEISKKVVFIASGSSYHASLSGVYFLRKSGIQTHAIVSSVFKNFTMFDKKTLVIAISQSGETMDVIKALNGIKSKGVKIASIVNVPYSTIQRMSNISINILAGQEISVASTKTFVNQVLTLLFISKLFGYDENLKEIPFLIKKVLKNKKIKTIAKKIKNKKDIYILGRGFSYPIAREIALKLKEVSYIHAEGMMGGELKHGTLALIEKGTPVLTLIPSSDEEIISNAKEVEARGANVIAIYENFTFSKKPETSGFQKNAEHSEFQGIKINANHKGSFSIICAIIGQLLTYHIAKEKKLPIDKPRNLAKCVTVK